MITVKYIFKFKCTFQVFKFFKLEKTNIICSKILEFFIGKLEITDSLILKKLQTI